MRNIRYYQKDSESFFNDKILSSTRKKNKLKSFNLESVRKFFFVQYKDLFIQNFLEKLTNSPLKYNKNKKNTPDYYYYHLYNSKITADLLDELTTTKDGERESSLCPYCQIRDAEDLDHYIPRSLYPFFSMNPINLIPICSKCNKLKSDNWLENGNRQILNYYTDKIFNEQFLFVELVSIDNSTPTFCYKLKKTPSLSQKEFDLINNHYSILQLIDKYNKKQSDTFNDLREEIRPGDKKEDIEDWINTHINNFGINYYKSVLWTFCINNSQICKLLNLL